MVPARSSSALRVGADAVAQGDARDRAQPHGGERRVEGGAPGARGAREREQAARVGDADEAADRHPEQARLEAADELRRRVGRLPRALLPIRTGSSLSFYALLGITFCSFSKLFSNISKCVNTFTIDMNTIGKCE